MAPLFGCFVKPDQVISSSSQEVIDRLNQFTEQTFTTRGGRIGSGMGLLLEGLWGYYTNQLLKKNGIDFEIAWLGDHQYNDFALVKRDKMWEPKTKQGELLRVEAKSMIRSADESKAYFDALKTQIDSNDLLLVLIWDWAPIDDYRKFPKVNDYFLGNALRLAALRDALHEARGGCFVQDGACPDRCGSGCSHVGEPLNARGKRERVSGPESTRPSMKVSFSANFGGLTRMIGTRTKVAKATKLRLCREDPVAKDYVAFIDRSVRGV
jgi:hypothetical protein